MTLLTAQPTSPANAATGVDARMATLRDRIVAHVHAMTPAQLRQLAIDLSTVRDEAELEDWEREYLAHAPTGAQVIRYGEQLIRLTTDPIEMPPYGPPLTEQEFLAELEAGSEEIRAGRGISGEVVLAELRSMLT